MFKIEKNKRYFFVTRGIPGCGKSTFIEKLFKNRDLVNKEDVTIISPDNLRIAYNGIKKDKDGREYIEQGRDYLIWQMVTDRLNTALLLKKFTVLDATSTRETDLNKYQKLADKFEVDLVVVDFSSVPVDVCQERNAARLPEYKRVPEDVILRMNVQINHPIQGDVSKHFIEYTEITEDSFKKKGKKQ